MRDGRSSLISAKLAEQRRIEQHKKDLERAELGRQIAEEEKKVKDLETWVSNWARAQQMREFISALEKLWVQQGHDLSSEAQKGQRIIWMKQQADRLDPMIPGPPSILDRKGELNSW
jgi:tRNA U55 pseudouridine synthase TruB